MRTELRGMQWLARAKDRAGGRQRFGYLPSRLSARGCPAMLGPESPRHNSLRGLRPLRSNKCRESEHVARCARGSRALRFSAAHRRAAGHPHGPLRAPAVVFGRAKSAGVARRARGHPSGAISGSASSTGPGEARTQCALPHLTRGVCLNGASAARAVSYAALARAEQHSAVGAATPRRPTQHEPLAGAPWRDARSTLQA